jgi:Flp pilus assembly secretin CpaC
VGGATSPSHVGIATLTLKSTLKIPSGQALLVGGMSSNGSAESSSQILFVVATEVVSR